MPLQQKASVCPLDCPDTCSLTVSVDGDRVVDVRGSRANPITGGAVCAKVSRFYPDFVHGARRLRYPLRRVGAKGDAAADAFQRIGWDEALDRIHDRVGAVIERDGPEAVLPFNYAGPHGKLAGESVSARFFYRLGASRLHRRALCGGVAGEAYDATFGAVPGTPIQQAADAKLIVVWGNNASVSNLHLVRYINAARRRGAKLVVVDPRRIKVAEQADLHLALRPGSDVVLAWALACELENRGAFDRAFIDARVGGAEDYMQRARRYPAERAAEVCGVPADAIRTLAGWYADADPALISIGNGLERNRNGGAGVRAVLALPALAGKFGRGGGIAAGDSKAFPATPQRLQRPDLAPPGPAPRTFNILDVSAALLDRDLDPPLNALFIYNHNPLIVHPEQNRMRRALARQDLFTVGVDVVMTDSLRYADVILPACSHFEHDDVYAAYGQQFLQRAEAVIPAVGESLPNTEIFRRLAARFGFDEPAFRDDDRALMDQAFDAADPRLGGRRPSRLPTDGALPMRFDDRDAVLFENVFPATPSGRVELASDDLQRRYGQRLPDYRPLAADPAFPLTLLSPSSAERITSTFGGSAGQTAPPLLMHPDDAAARGLRDGARVRVWNPLGEVRLTLTVSDAVRPGVVSADKGAWLHTSDNGQTVSALAPLHKADLAGGACFNDARVEVAAV